MIQSKDDLIYYLSEDRKYYPCKPSVKDWLFRTEKYYIWTFITELRNTEYKINTCNIVFDKILLYFQYIKFYRLMHKTQL